MVRPSRPAGLSSARTGRDSAPTAQARPACRNWRRPKAEGKINDMPHRPFGACPASLPVGQGQVSTRASARAHSNSVPRTGLQPAGRLVEDDGSRWERVGSGIGSSQSRGGWPNVIGPKGDAAEEGCRHGKNRRGGYAGESGAGRHLIGSRAARLVLVRAVLTWLIARHSCHMIPGHGHRHSAHAHRHRDRKGDDEDKKRAGDGFRHDGKGNAGQGSFQAEPRNHVVSRAAETGDC